jgi:ribonuclease HI
MQKLSISLPLTWIQFIDDYKATNGCKSRSQVIEAALALLQQQAVPQVAQAPSLDTQLTNNSKPAVTETDFNLDREIIVYTDGACKGNPGPGGWAAILLCGDHQKELSGGEPQTTNNRMEMMAAIKALQALTRPCVVKIHSDSQLVINTMTRNWKRKMNLDLWAELDRLTKIHKVEWIWVKGHASDPLNCRADELAVIAARQIRKPTHA